jgi:hypothetical protein
MLSCYEVFFVGQEPVPCGLYGSLSAALKAGRDLAYPEAERIASVVSRAGSLYEEDHGWYVVRFDAGQPVEHIEPDDVLYFELRREDGKYTVDPIPAEQVPDDVVMGDHWRPIRNDNVGTIKAWWEGEGHNIPDFCRVIARAVVHGVGIKPSAIDVFWHPRKAAA